MLPFNELARTQEYWMTNIQCDLYLLVLDYAVVQKWPAHPNKQLSELLGITRIKASQIINGDFDGTLAELIEYSLKLGAAPLISFDSLDSYVENFLDRDKPNSRYRAKNNGE